MHNIISSLMRWQWVSAVLLIQDIKCFDSESCCVWGTREAVSKWLQTILGLWKFPISLTTCVSLNLEALIETRSLCDSQTELTKNPRLLMIIIYSRSQMIYTQTVWNNLIVFKYCQGFDFKSISYICGRDRFLKGKMKKEA